MMVPLGWPSSAMETLHFLYNTSSESSSLACQDPRTSCMPLLAIGLESSAENKLIGGVDNTLGAEAGPRLGFGMTLVPVLV